jgi:carbon-monoxide dehydrogenase medium subunit
MKNFAYQKVSNLEEAFLLLRRYQEKAKVLAGGTDLLVKMRHKALCPEILIDLKGIPGMDTIQYDPDRELKIGALASLHSLEVSPIIKERFGIISEAAGLIGSRQIRARATLGGNLCNASPAADMAPALLALGARVSLNCNGEERSVPLEEFFVGPGRSVLKKDELLIAVHIPPPPPRTGSRYAKFSIRKAMDVPIVGVAVVLTLDTEKDRCQDIRIALGACATVPLRAPKAEARLRGREIGEISIREASMLAAEEAQPITDLRATAEYRREIVRVMTERTLREIQRDLA